MTENEAKLIISDLERINKRVDTIDNRLADFITAAGTIQKIEEQVKTLNNNQLQNSESIGRAFQEIGKIKEVLVDRKKIENMMDKVDNLESAPASKTYEAVNKFKSTLFATICGAVASGVLAFIIWLVNSFLKR